MKASQRNEAIDRMLAASQRGEPGALDQLLVLAYEPLKSIATLVVGTAGDYQTLGPTALVHEGFMKLQRGESLPGIQNSQHFFALFANCMKQALLDYVRHKKRLKRGGHWRRIEWEATLATLQVPESRLSELLEALDALREKYPRAASIFEARTFASQTIDQTAALHQLSASTVEVEFRFARAFLRNRLA